MDVATLDLPRAECVFIHNQAYQSRNCCSGSHDSQKLLSLFQDHLQIDRPYYLKDLTVKNIFSKLEEAKDMFREMDCLFITLLSHVSSAGVELVDGGLVPFFELIEVFSEKNCSKLKDKPKIILIKSCYDDNAVPYVVPFLKEKQFLIIEAPTPKSISEMFLNRDSPSEFINCFFEGIAKNGDKFSLYHLIPSIIKNERERNTSSANVPVPKLTSTLCTQLPLLCRQIQVEQNNRRRPTVQREKYQGICLIFQISKFDDARYPQKEAGAYDLNKIMLFFRYRLQFHVKRFDNFSAHDIRLCLKKIENSQLDDYQNIFLIMTSYSDKYGNIVASDGDVVSLDEVKACFRSDNVQTSNKVLILDASYCPNEVNDQKNKCEAKFKHSANYTEVNILTVTAIHSSEISQRLFTNTCSASIGMIIETLVEFNKKTSLLDVITTVNSKITTELQDACFFEVHGTPTDSLELDIYPESHPDGLPLEDDPYYEIGGIPRGFCIIIDNISNPLCLGFESNYNIERLHYLFENVYGFHVQVYSQLSVGAIKKLLHFVIIKDHSSCSCFALCILAYGNPTKIFGASYPTQKDDFMKIEEIEDNFITPCSKSEDHRGTQKDCSDNNCHSCMHVTLNGKPKVFVYDIWLTQEDQLVETRGRSYIRLPNNKYERTANDAFRMEVNVPKDCQHPSGKCYYVEALALTEMKNPNISLDALLKVESKMLREVVRRQIRLDDYANCESLTNLKRVNITAKNILELGAAVGNKLRLAYEMWTPMRTDTIETLKSKKEKVVQVTRDSRISRIAGASAGITGGIVSIVGFSLVPVTLGLSIIIAGVGGGIALSGGLTSLGAVVADAILSNRELSNAQECLTIDKQLCQVINNLQIELETITNILAEKLPNTSRESIAIAFLSGTQSALRLSSIAAKAGVSGAKIAEIAATTSLDGSIILLRVASAATKGIAIAGGVVSALVLPLDIYELVMNSYKFHKKKDTNASTWIQEQIDNMEEQQRQVEELLQRQGSQHDND